MTPLIRLKNVNFSYSTADGIGAPILKTVDLEIGAGELVAIQGPSGSGKSTLLYIIGCLLDSYEGTVEIAGRDIATLNSLELAVLRNRHIGFVFQQFHLLPKATVLENVLLPNQYPTEIPPTENLEQKARALIDQLGLKERIDSYPNQLSGGQQQRVSIARALLNDTQIILADEPTGSLDTINSKQIVDLLKSVQESGRTVIIITHDSEVANQCDRVIHFRDGRVAETVGQTRTNAPLNISVFKTLSPLTGYLRTALTLFPLALSSLKQNRTRSALTMLGIVIGVAAVLSMITVGSFTKKKILESYAEMGVNTIAFSAYPNWDLKATDIVATVFQSMDWKNDLQPLRRIFPDLEAMSPMLRGWDGKANFGGKIVDSDVAIMGVSSDGLKIANRKLILGTGLSPYHVEYRSAVCVIGFEVYERLFSQVSPIGQILYVSQNDQSFGCRVTGVLSSQTSNKSWNKPNLQIFVPYTFFQGISNPWNSRIRNFAIQARAGTDIEALGRSIKAFFKSKYGKSMEFDVGSDSVLIAQMNKFLSLFTILLGAIALVSLGVGGIGITNMMMVSVTERFKEIGIRKAFGATNFSIRVQYLVESVLICGVAGLIGLVIGFALYETAIYGATKLVSKLKFEWVIDWVALLLSVASIFIVGVLSGLSPALRAEKLQVIESLRSE